MSFTDPSRIKGVNTNQKMNKSKSPLRQTKFKHLENTSRGKIDKNNSNNDEYQLLKQSIKDEILNEI